MADDGTLTLRVTADLVPFKEALNALLQEVTGKKYKFDFVPGPEGGGGSGEGYADNKGTAREASEASASLKDGIKNYLKDEDNQRKLITKGINQAEKAISTSLTKGFGIVEEIYAKLKSASPLLQTIESLFNLAMTLFFMPLGNKLAEVLIPATVELLDAVVSMWDAFEGKTLGQMFEYAISNGVKLFGAYFNNIGDALEKEGGMVGKIGELMNTVGDFIQGPGIGVLNTILTVTTLVLSHLKEFISMWVAMKVAELTLSAMGNIESATLGKVVAVTAIASLVAGGAAYGALTGMGMAEGGYVPAKPGGSVRVLGEGGKGEYVIPEDKMGGVGGSTTINIYGYTDRELKQIIRDTVNEQVSQSRIRGSF